MAFSKSSPEWLEQNEAYMDAALAMIGGDSSANAWFKSFCNYILAVDHVYDEDQMAGVEQEAMLQRMFDWESNSFWIKAKTMMLPVCFSSYISWKMGSILDNRDSEMSVYFNVPSAMGFILNGREHVEAHAPELFKQVQLFKQVDDQCQK